MKRRITLAFVSFFSTVILAQEKSTVGINFTGFVKSDIFYDTRQTVSIREGQFHLYPTHKDNDEYGTDINSKDNFNILSIQTRLTGNINGPDAFGAKTSALIEGAFFGHSSPDINGFRLRHAYAKLKWDNSELLIGQFWHAMFITDCFPGTINFNTGAPFQPFSRNPQVRYTQNVNPFKFILTAMTQRDFSSTGPDGTGSQYLRNNTLPELNLTVQFLKKNNDGNEWILGVGADYLSLTPRIETPLGFATNENFDAFSYMAFLKMKSKSITWKLEGILGQNTYHLTMLGGYAEVGITNPTIQEYEYSPINIFSIWTELHTNGKDIQFGIFGGYTKNQGTVATPSNLSDIYARGANIDYIYRISPRMTINSGKMQFTGEIEYTVAAYGTTQHDLTVDNSKEIANLRFLIGVYYFF